MFDYTQSIGFNETAPAYPFPTQRKQAERAAAALAAAAILSAATAAKAAAKAADKLAARAAAVAAAAALAAAGGSSSAPKPRAPKKPKTTSDPSSDSPSKPKKERKPPGEQKKHASYSEMQAATLATHLKPGLGETRYALLTYLCHSTSETEYQTLPTHGPHACNALRKVLVEMIIKWVHTAIGGLEEMLAKEPMTHHDSVVRNFSSISVIARGMMNGAAASSPKSFTEWRYIAQELHAVAGRVIVVRSMIPSWSLREGSAQLRRCTLHAEGGCPFECPNLGIVNRQLDLRNRYIKLHDLLQQGFAKL